MIGWTRLLQSAQVVFSPTWFSPTSPSIKQLGLDLEPIFFDNGTISQINVQLSVQNNLIPANQPFLRHFLMLGPVPTVDYNSTTLALATADGPVSLYTEDSDTFPVIRFWSARDDIVGDFFVNFTAVPATLDVNSPCGPTAGLVRQNGGVLGSGLAFVPQLISEQQWNITILWQLDNNRSHVRAVSSLGETLQASVINKASLINELVFAIGSLASYPSYSSSSSFGMYWFRPPQFNTTSLGARLQNLTSAMAGFFHDEVADYRIFAREDPNCPGGMAFYRSFIFSWLPDAPRLESSLFQVVAHEAVHNWPRLDSRPPLNGTAIDQDGWWTEGIADYYTGVLSFKFGFSSEKEYVDQMNTMASVYYTSPYINGTYEQLATAFWDNVEMAWMIYRRGFMYFVHLAASLRNNGSTQSLDDLIQEFVQARLNGSMPYDVSTWLSLVSSKLGNKTTMIDYNDVTDGVHVIRPSTTNSLPLLDSYKFERHDQEMFQLGFPESILQAPEPRFVYDLDPDSRAALQGGVKNDDQVLEDGTKSLSRADLYDAEMVMRVRRRRRQQKDSPRSNLREFGFYDSDEEFEELELRWWPRSWHKVESWRWVGR